MNKIVKTNRITSILRLALLALCLGLLTGTSAFAGTSIRSSNSTVSVAQPTTQKSGYSAYNWLRRWIPFENWWWIRR